ncbi:Cytochrome b-c1 complex subunit 6, mitochondrial [Leucoagaricus gongylophorus]
MALSDLFSSLKSTIYADSEEKESEEKGQESPVEEEEEEEPEDLHPAIRDECKETKCMKLTKHFDHCQEKVHSGQGFKGEDCVEELCMY